MFTEVPLIATGVRAKARSARLPERLNSSWRTILVAGDAAIVFFVSLVTLGGVDNRVVAAVVTAAIVCGVFWECGYYRRCYAVSAWDEVYYACAGVLFSALPIALILSAVAGVPGAFIALTLFFTAVATACVHARAHIERRSGAPLSASIPSITAGAWHDRESASFTLMKRLFDVCVGLLALVVASPVMLLAAAAVWLEDRGPVIFTQERIGAGGRPFRIIKFRTMRVDAGTAWVRPGDDRITRTGAFLRRTSIDELPQLLNVLRGDMALVGPRPEMVEFAARFSEELPNYGQRHVVSPGITGWAQLYYKRSLTPEDAANVLPLDLFYVEHASVLLDTVLLIKTLFEVAAHRAI